MSVALSVGNCVWIYRCHYKKGAGLVNGSGQKWPIWVIDGTSFAPYHGSVM